VSGLIQVHLVDDDSAFLTALSRLLRVCGHSVAVFHSAGEFVAQVTCEKRGCIVADLDMPNVTGLELQGLLKEKNVTMPLIFLTGRGNIPSSVQAMRRGAIDFLEKLVPQERLLAAIEHALQSDEEQHRARLLLEGRRQKFASLTPREREILKLVVNGKMNKQIAAELGIHERTVKLHRTAITTKLGVHQVAKLAVLANEAQLEIEGSPRESNSQDFLLAR
jgi:two-component system, LuxR family, response regulator FixJ